VLTINNPTCENGELLDNGSIEIETTGLVDGTYDFAYDGGTFEGVEVVDNQATIPASGGIYNNIVIGSGNCQSLQGVSAEVIEPDCDLCIQPIPGGEWNKSINQQQSYTMDNLNYDNITIEGGNAGMILDIYSLDNSFDLKVNNQSIASTEIQFDTGSSNVAPGAETFNIRFVDGDLYKYDTPSIWQITGTTEKPMIRVEVNPDGEVKLYGSKESGGALYELQMYNDATLNNVTWNENGTNTLSLSQDANGWTKLNGKVYGVDMCEA